MFGKKKKTTKVGDKPTTPAGVLPSLPPPAAPLEEELRSVWKLPLTKTPVYKDLPRLAQRIVVLGSLKAPAIASEKFPKEASSSTSSDVPVLTTTKVNSRNPASRSNSVNSKNDPTKTNTSSIKPNDSVPSISYKIYLNTSEINISRAAHWPATYDIRTLNIFVADGKIFLEFMDENESDVICRAEGSQLIAVEDSSRYFVIMQAHHETNPKVIRNTGFAFYTRDEAQQFAKFASEHAHLTIPIVAAGDFASVDNKHKEMKIIPLIVTEPEGYIEEDTMLEIDQFAKQMLNEIGSSKKQPEQLISLRDSITLRLSKQGLGVIVTKEERRLSSKLLNGGSLTTAVSKNLPIIVAIRRVVNAVAAELETPEHAALIAAELSKPENDAYEGDLEILVDQVFNVIGHDSKTARVFKALTQAIIHTATYQIKSTIQSKIMTGDVRGPEGWQIVVLFAHDVINISHRRREKSLDSLGPKHKFWYEWVLHMVFDKKMGDLASCSLRVSDIGYGDEIDPKVKEEVAATFCNGDLLIA